jgi:hypothetical protein
MKLKDGDKIYCTVDNVNNLTKNKCYEVIKTRENIYSGILRKKVDDICIKDDTGLKWWFGQIGEFEPWTMWFITEKEWLRNEKLKELGI